MGRIHFGKTIGELDGEALKDPSIRVIETKEKIVEVPVDVHHYHNYHTEVQTEVQTRDKHLRRALRLLHNKVRDNHKLTIEIGKFTTHLEGVGVSMEGEQKKLALSVKENDTAIQYCKHVLNEQYEKYALLEKEVRELRMKLERIKSKSLIEKIKELFK
jgi:hypothetical protein